MGDHWTIMLIGISTVFVGLFVIQLIIGLLKFFFSPDRQKKDRPVIHKTETGDSELVAVLSAAIAAASGQSTGSFRIAAIEPAQGNSASFNTPTWGHIERLKKQGHAR